MTDRLYGDLAQWWPLLSPPEHQAPAAAALLQMAPGTASLLDLGSGSGALISHLPDSIEAVLVDRSADMLAVSAKLNPNRRHVQADLCTLDLGRTFDLVLLHDAVMYLPDDGALDRALAVASRHLGPGGRLVVVPDVLADDFDETVVTGTGESPDGRRVVLTEWHWDPVPGDGRTTVEMSLLIKVPGQPVVAVHETHTLLLISHADLWQAIRSAGLTPVAADPLAAMALGQPFVAEKPR